MFASKNFPLVIVDGNVIFIFTTMCWLWFSSVWYSTGLFWWLMFNLPWDSTKSLFMINCLAPELMYVIFQLLQMITPYWDVYVEVVTDDHSILGCICWSRHIQSLKSWLLEPHAFWWCSILHFFTGIWPSLLWTFSKLVYYHWLVWFSFSYFNFQCIKQCCSDIPAEVHVD